ncbi:MAG: ergothioneine biosynthesis protein EgtB [Acidimicrobiia bacterium]
MSATDATKAALADALGEARDRTLALLDPVPVADQTRQVSPLMSPLCWDLGHVAHFEELWLLRTVARATPTVPRLDDVYDAFKHPRRERPDLDMLDPIEAREFAADVRKRALDVLATVDLERTVPLLENGFVYRMIVQHEHQHDETMLATLQLMENTFWRHLPTTVGGTRRQNVPGEVLVDGGTFVMGTDDDPWAYDNERPAHAVEVAPFWIDTAPVTNGAYVEFVAAGGYDDPQWWTDAGWAWRTEAGLEHPEFWRAAGAGWERRRFGRWEPLPADEPVQHVCWYEADAYSRCRGKRLPTEAEWEKAATWDPAAGTKLRHPWGDGPATPAHANLAHVNGSGTRFGPDPIGSRPDGVSPWGCHQMVGDVWEWTASDFAGYPGFRAFPYREYSEVFFGPEYKVLRGGSWGAHPSVAARATFRNWDYPIRRQIFAGFRCARDS